MSLIDYLKGRGVKHDYFQSLEFDEKEFIFFIMPFKKPYTNLFEKHLRPLIKKEFQMDAEIATDRFIVNAFTNKIWQQICEARLVIAEISGWNKNVLYELGLVHALSKKCILIARKKTRFPSDLIHIDRIDYKYNLLKKDIDGFEKKLISAIKQVLERGKVEVADFTDWQQARGPWLVREKALELSALYISPDAYYIWNPAPFSNSINLKFRLRFIKQKPADFRIALFSTSPLETYIKSHHLLLLVPWDGGDSRIDGLVNGEVTHFAQGNKTKLPSVGQQYYYDISIDDNHIKIKIDGKLVLQESTNNITQFRIIPAYWGFSSVGGSFQVSELEIEMK